VTKKFDSDIRNICGKTSSLYQSSAEIRHTTRCARATLSWNLKVTVLQYR